MEPLGRSISDKKSFSLVEAAFIQTKLGTRSERVILVKALIPPLR